MRDQGCNCYGCYANRRAYWVNCMIPICWVCLLVFWMPAFMSGPLYRIFGGEEDKSNDPPA